MAKFLIRANYTTDGIRGLLKEGGSSRRAVVTKAIEGVGGTVESFHYAFGEDDVIVIADVPDSTAAAALGLSVGAGGGARTSMTLLIMPEEIDDAVKLHSEYRAPGA